MSRYGSIAGVPVAVGGVLFFGFVLLMVWGSRTKSRVEDSAPAYFFAVSTLALAVVLYLAYASFFILKEVCPLCVTTYIAVIGVFVISGGASSVPMSSLPRRALRDIRVLVTTPVALFAALVFVTGAASAVEFFPKDGRQAAQQPPAAALNQDQRSEFERWWDQQERVEVPFSNEGAKVLIVEVQRLSVPAVPADLLFLRADPGEVQGSSAGREVSVAPFSPRPALQLRRAEAGAPCGLRRGGGGGDGWIEGHVRQTDRLVLHAPGRAEPGDGTHAPPRTSAASRTSTRATTRRSRK